MLHRSVRGIQSTGRIVHNHMSRRLYAVRENVSSVEKAVAEATSALMERLKELELENANLRRALQSTMHQERPQEIKHVKYEEENSDILAALSSTDDSPMVKENIEEQGLDKHHAVAALEEATEADEVEDYEAVKSKSKQYGGTTPRKFFFRLMECTKKYELSPKLRKMLTSMPLMEMEWNHQVAPAILTALILLGREEDAKTFTEKWSKHLPVLRFFMIQSARLNSSEIALCILSTVSEHHNAALDTFFFSCAIGACSRGPASHVPVAYDLFNDMQEREIEASPKTYAAILSACARLDDLNRAQEIISIIDTLPNKDEVYAIVIQEIGLQNHHEFAYRLFKHVLDQGIQIPERVIRVAVSSCAKIADREDAIATLDYLVKKMPPTSSTLLYNAIISAYANLKPSMGFALFESMKKKNVPADIFTYNSVLLACVRQRDFKRGLELFHAMPVPFDIVTICTMLQLCRQSSEINHASTLYFKALNTLGPSGVLFEEYVETLVENNAMQNALDVYHKNKSTATFLRTSKLLNLLLRACVDDPVTAQAIFDKFTERPVPISSVSWNHLMGVYIAAGDFENAEQLLQTMEGRKLATVFTYQQLMHAYYKKKQYAKCTRIYEQFMNLRFHQMDFGVRSKPLRVPQSGINILASRSYFEQKEYSQVIAMASSFNAPRLRGFTDGCKRELIRQSILASEHQDDWQNCVRLYGELVRAGCSDVLAYESTVRAVAKAGEFEAALDVDNGDWYRNERHSKGWFHDANE